MRVIYINSNYKCHGSLITTEEYSILIDMIA